MIRRLSWFLCAWALLTVPALQGADPAPARPLSRIVFGSCADQNKPCPIWDKIAAAQPDLLVLLGDNIYADIEDGKLVPAKPDKIAACYKELNALPAFKAIRDKTPIVATWDDHDYGKNDAGVEYEYKDQSQKMFLDFFEVPADSPRRQQKGVYHAVTYGPPGQRVQVIMLDLRYFRSPLKRADKPLAGTRIVPYLPNEDAGATMLGDDQWKWLEERLKEPAEVRLIGSSIQFVTEDHPFEKWSNIPAERAKMLQLLRKTEAKGVIFLSGDRHLGELSVETSALGYPLYDITSSGFNQATKEWRAPEKNSRRVSAMPYGDNFGMITIDWSRPDPLVSLQLRDDQGEITVRQAFPLSTLKPDAAVTAVKLPEGVVGPLDARDKIGQEITIQFTVAGGRAFKDRILLNSEKDFRSEKNFTVVVSEKAMTGDLAKADYDTFKGKTIKAQGKVTKYRDQIEMIIEDVSKIQILK